MLSVCDGVTDDTFKEGLEDTTGLFVDHCWGERTLVRGVKWAVLVVLVSLTGRDTLDTATTSETTDSGLGDTLDVVTQNLAVTLGTTLSEAFATFATCGRETR